MKKVGDLLLLDMGHAFVRYVLLHFDSESGVRVRASGEVVSEGFIHGAVSDIDLAAEKIRDVIETAMDAAEVHRVDGIWVGHSGQHIRSDNVTQEKVLDNNKPVTSRIEVNMRHQAENYVPSDCLLLHSYRQYSILDGIRLISPLKQVGTRLSSRFHLIYTRLTVINNLNTAFREAGYKVHRYIFNAISASSAVVGSLEKRLGCLLIHLGSSTCDYVVFQEGKPFLSGSLNEGWRNLTRDVAVGFQISSDKARDLIIEKGAAYDLGSELNEALEVQSISGRQSKMTRRNLWQIMSCAIEDIFIAIRDRLKNDICRGHIQGGVILTGGGALTKGITYCTEDIFGVHAQVGIPEFSVNGERYSPAWAPLAGMIQIAYRDFRPLPRSEKVLEYFTVPARSLWHRMFPKAVDPEEPEGEAFP